MLPEICMHAVKMNESQIYDTVRKYIHCIVCPKEIQCQLYQKIYAGQIVGDRVAMSGEGNPPLIGQMVRFDTHLSTTLHQHSCAQ